MTRLTPCAKTILRMKRKRTAAVAPQRCTTKGVMRSSWCWYRRQDLWYCAWSWAMPGVSLVSSAFIIFVDGERAVKK
jgi:hypothetical protein